MGRFPGSAVLVSSLLVLPLLASCEADQPLKAKQGDADRATSAVSTVAPSAASGWTLRDASIESSHPYGNRTHQTFSITEPGAASIRVHFGAFDLENGYDWVTLSAPDGNARVTYTGKLGDFWSSEIPGSTVVVSFDSDASVTRTGFSVLGYAARNDGESWRTKAFVWETPHPYTNDDARFVEIDEPGAVKMKVLFEDLDVEDGYDFVRVFDAAGRLVAEYTGALHKLETPAIPGDHLSVEFVSDGSVTAPGVKIAQYSFLLPQDEPSCTVSNAETPVCGENGLTYANASAAACQGVAVKHAGACGVTGDFCGGLGGIQCSDGYSCRLDGTWADASGSCVKN